ncbi:hypothetical protein BGZ72_003685 [Mortierella alpina]|nr:hypothetical protein BGZ72_003685 [Mortierella alpina]
MTKDPVQRVRKAPASARLSPYGKKATPLHLPTTVTQQFTPAELEEKKRLRQERYDDLLQCARSGDASSLLILPSADPSDDPMAKVHLPLSVKLEYLDIYHYLQSRQGDFLPKLSYSNFGSLIGCHLPKTTLSRMLRDETQLRAANKAMSEGSHSLEDCKHDKLDQGLHRCLEAPEQQNTLVDAKAIKKAEETPNPPVEDDDDLTEEEWQVGMRYLRSLAGGHDVFSAAGLKEIYERTKGGNEHMLKIRQSIKELVHIARRRKMYILRSYQ